MEGLLDFLDDEPPTTKRGVNREEGDANEEEEGVEEELFEFADDDPMFFRGIQVDEGEVEGVRDQQQDE